MVYIEKSIVLSHIPFGVGVLLAPAVKFDNSCQNASLVLPVWYGNCVCACTIKVTSGGGTGGATGALAPLIVKFRGLSPPKMYCVCLVPSRLNFFRLDGWVYTRLQ